MNEQNLTYLAKGHRGIIYLTKYKGKKAVIKKEKAGSKAINRIPNEANYLKILNKIRIGPKLFCSDSDSIISEYIDGPVFPEWLKKASKRHSLQVIEDIYQQCFKMDKLKISKEEMHHPHKHIIISNNKPIMIDFERCHKTLQPMNVTQFSSYMLSRNIRDKLNKKYIFVDKERLIAGCKVYKSDMTESNLKKILTTIR